MEPNIIVQKTMLIAGISGDGKDTGNLWHTFEEVDKKNHLSNIVNEVGYEVRIHSDDGKVKCHVGVLVKDKDVSNDYEILELPPFMYAMFEVQPQKGYKSENESMDKWLLENKDVFKQGSLDGKPFSVLVYGEKYKGEDSPDSIVEVWVPVSSELICQSCSMPMSSSNVEILGNNKDGSKNRDYCIHCYKDGEFTVEATMEEMIEECIPYTSNNNPWPDKETARNTMMKIFPNLKRWKVN